MGARGVVFDLFHTLVNPDPLKPEGWHPTWAIAELLDIEPEPFRAFWQRTFIERETTPIEMPDLVARYMATAGRMLSDEDAATIDGYFGVGNDHAITEPDPRMADLVRELAARGPVGVLSNCYHRETAGWAASPFAPWVAVLTRSCDIGVRKPDVGAYLVTLDALGLAGPECTFVGNGGDDELVGARQAGFGRVVHCNVYDRPNGVVSAEDQATRAAQADVSVATIEDLRDALLQPG